MKRLTYLIILSALVSCGQIKKDNDHTQTMLKNISDLTLQEINTDNIVDYMAAQVKIYDTNPKYAIRPFQNNCIFVILVNDRPIYREFSLEKTATPVTINSNILKSGPQTITYRLYPIGDLMVNEFGKGETVSTLRRNTSMKIEVIEYEDGKTGTGLSDETIIAKHTSPINKETGAFIGTDLPYYENTFTFNAEVPYENRGWLNGEDLSKFETEDLERVVRNKNLMIKELYEEKNIDSLVRVEYVKGLDYDIANYRTKDEIQKIFNRYKYQVQVDKDFQPLEGYQLELYGENKIVTLRFPITNPLNWWSQGRPALHYFYEDDDGDTSVHLISLYFYLPKGKELTAENLQIL